MQSAAWCEGLLREFERRIEACLPRMSNARDRLTTEECASLVEFAAGMVDPLGGASVCPILPGETGFFDIHKNRDTIAATLLEKADPRDGGGRGIPVETPGPGSGLMNAAAAGAFGGNCASLEKARTYSLPLRAAVARMALSRMPDFLDDDSHGEYFRAKFDLYGPEIVDEAKGRGACMDGYPDEFPLPIGSARVLYLLAVQRVTRELADCQQACLPWLAETLSLKIRCFHAGAGRSVAESASKTWSRKTFLPLGRSGRSSRRKVREIPTVYMSMSLVRKSGDPGSPDIIAEERVDPRSPGTRRHGSRRGARTYGRFGLLLPLAKGRSIESSSASEDSEGQDSSDDGTGSEKEARDRARKKAKRKAKAHREDHRSRSKRRRSREKKKASKRSSRSERREFAEEEEERRRKAKARDEELDRALDEERKEMRAQARADARAQAGGSAASFRREPRLINAGGGSAHDGPSQPSSPGADTSERLPSQTSSTEAGQRSSALGGDNPEPCTSRRTSTNNHSSSSNNHGSSSSTSCHGKTSGIDKNGGGSGMNTSVGEGAVAGGGEVEASAALMSQVHVGRTFEKLGSADETWDSAVASLLAAFRVEGHNCLMRRNKKKLYYEEYAHRKKFENRHWVVWVTCTHGGAPVARTPPSREVIRRRVSRKVMCPFKVAICWPQRELAPRITQVNVTHNHGLADAHGTKRGGNSGQVSLDALMGGGYDEVADPTPNTTERARQKAYAAIMATASAMAAKLADSVSPAAATNIFAEAMAVANTRLLAAGVEGPPPPPSESGVDVGLPLGNPAAALAEQTEMEGECGPTYA